jgi:hypothetical protein
MPEQQPLFYDSVYDAIGTVVTALGGKKKVGPLLWPHLKAETAYTRLAHCLSEEFPEKLAPEEILFLARKGREADCHAILSYLSMECGYSPPAPIDPLDEGEALRRDIRDGVASLNRRLERLERLEQQGRVRAVGGE